MNNSFARLIDGMNATLRTEVLTRLDDEFARGQVFGVINLLNTFKVRADWSAKFLLEQIEAQRVALKAAEESASRAQTDAASLPTPPSKHWTVPDQRDALRSIEPLLAARDEGNRAIGEWLDWLDASRPRLSPTVAGDIEKALRAAMRAEVDIELRNSPRPLFAQMSSGREE